MNLVEDELVTELIFKRAPRRCAVCETGLSLYGQGYRWTMCVQTRAITFYCKRCHARANLVLYKATNEGIISTILMHDALEAKYFYDDPAHPSRKTKPHLCPGEFEEICASIGQLNQLVHQFERCIWFGSGLREQVCKMASHEDFGSIKCSSGTVNVRVELTGPCMITLEDPTTKQSITLVTQEDESVSLWNLETGCEAIDVTIVTDNHAPYFNVKNKKSGERHLESLFDFLSFWGDGSIESEEQLTPLPNSVRAWLVEMGFEPYGLMRLGYIDCTEEMGTSLLQLAIENWPCYENLLYRICRAGMP